MINIENTSIYEWRSFPHSFEQHKRKGRGYVNDRHGKRCENCVTLLCLSQQSTNHKKARARRTRITMKKPFNALLHAREAPGLLIAT